MSKELLHEWVNIAWYAERTLMQRRFRVTFYAITFLHACSNSWFGEYHRGRLEYLHKHSLTADWKG